MHRLVKRDRLWLYSMDSYRFSQRKAIIPPDITFVIVPDAFLLALDTITYPNTKDGALKLFLDWSNGAYIYSPNRNELFVYETIGFDSDLGTYGGQWRKSKGFSESVQDWDCTACLKECWDEIQEGITDLQEKVKTFSQPQQRAAKELSDIAAQRKSTFADIPSCLFLKYIKENACKNIDFYQKDNGTLINCRNGVYDLEKMQFRSTQRTDFLEYVLPIKYDPYANDPNLWPFLDWVFGGDNDKLEFTLGVISTLFNRNLPVKPIIIFYHKNPSSLCQYFMTFLRSFLTPFIQVFADYKRRTSKDWRPSETIRLDQTQTIPRVQFFNEIDKKMSMKEWQLISQMGKDDQPHKYTVDRQSFSFQGSVLTVVETNKLPHFNFTMQNPVYIIPLDTPQWQQQTTYSINLYSNMSDTTHSMMLNLLIEAYQRWTDKVIPVPEQIKKLSQC